MEEWIPLKVSVAVSVLFTRNTDNDTNNSIIDINKDINDTV